MSVHVHVVAETHALHTNVVTVGSYVYMYRYDIPLSDLISFAERARSALCKSCCLLAVRFFRYLARSFLFQGLLDTLRVRSLFRVCSIPCAFVPFSGSARYLLRREVRSFSRYVGSARRLLRPEVRSFSGSLLFTLGLFLLFDRSG